MRKSSIKPTVAVKATPFKSAVGATLGTIEQSAYLVQDVVVLTRTYVAVAQVYADTSLAEARNEYQLTLAQAIA